ncbi:MAG TPA: signal peptidase I [Bacteroidales bacterium]|nr:signal peptidase I [Bacteroidales bacterium]
MKKSGNYIVRLLKTSCSFILQFGGSFVLILFIVVAFRVFIGEILTIESKSMERTFFNKDIIYVNKSKIGVNYPTTLDDIPWLGTIVYYFDSRFLKNMLSYSLYKSSINYPIRKVNCNDVIILKNPNSKDLIVKRCVAKGGDVLNISKDNIKIRGVEIKKSSQNSISRIKIDTVYKKLNKETIDFIKINIGQKESSFDDKYFGEYVIPFKGYKIKLSAHSLYLYKDLIERFENRCIHIKDGDFYIDDALCEEYTFLRDYYFVIGDNIPYSSDSRYFGLVPDFLIVGKAEVIIYSPERKILFNNI